MMAYCPSVRKIVPSPETIERYIINCAKQGVVIRAPIPIPIQKYPKGKETACRFIPHDCTFPFFVRHFQNRSRRQTVEPVISVIHSVRLLLSPVFGMFISFVGWTVYDTEGFLKSSEAPLWPLESIGVSVALLLTYKL